MEENSSTAGDRGKGTRGMFKNGATRVVSVVKIDYKAGGVTIDEKMGNIAEAAGIMVGGE